MLRKLSTKTLTDLSLVKEHLKVDYTEEDTLIGGYIDVAHNLVEDYTSIAIGVQTFEEYLTADMAEDFVYLSMNPLVAISEVIEISEVDGTEVNVTSDIVKITNSLGTRLKTDKKKSYKVTYSAGVDLADIPKQMHQAILLCTSDMFENRIEKVKQKRTSVEYLLNQVSIKRI
jgi:uncharacterized phiE125 gp8 family phage protein